MLTCEFSTVESIIHSDQVPTLPEVTMEVLRVARQAEPDLHELTRVIRMDPAIAGRIVKFSNSPLFGIRRTSATIEAAIVQLGTTMIPTLVLGFSLAEQGPVHDTLRPHFQQIWRETLFQASAAEFLGQQHSGVDPGNWFLAGLLQDVGRLVMLNVFRLEYLEQVIQGDSEVCLCDRESQAFGFCHADVSAALCHSWNLGDDIFRAVSAHHTEHASGSDEFVTVRDGLYTASVCNQYMESVSKYVETARNAVERELISVHGCRPDQVVENLEEMDRHAQGLATVLQADVGAMASREAILEKAHVTLFDIALTKQLRRLNPRPQVTQTSECSQAGDTGGLDPQTGAFGVEVLERILPLEIAESAEKEHTLGLFAVEVGPVDKLTMSDTLRVTAEAIRFCIRPNDQIIRRGKSGFVVVLPELSMIMLVKVARRFIERASEKLAEAPNTVRVGGLVVIPAGRRVASVKSVLRGLESSLNPRDNADREHFLTLRGKKLHSALVQF